MKTSRVAATLAVLVIVVGVIVIASFSTRSATTTSTFTTTSVFTTVGTYTDTVQPNGYVEATGTCTAVSWVQPDIASVSASTTTITSGNSTSYSTHYVTTLVAPFPYNSSTYSTTSYVNTTPPFTVQTTSSDYTDGPSALWTITDCTFGD